MYVLVFVAVHYVHIRNGLKDTTASIATIELLNFFFSSKAISSICANLFFFRLSFTFPSNWLERKKSGEKKITLLVNGAKECEMSLSI